MLLAMGPTTTAVLKSDVAIIPTASGQSLDVRNVKRNERNERNVKIPCDRRCVARPQAGPARQAGSGISLGSSAELGFLTQKMALNIA